MLCCVACTRALLANLWMPCAQLRSAVLTGCGQPLHKHPTSATRCRLGPISRDMTLWTLTATACRVRLHFRARWIAQRSRTGQQQDCVGVRGLRRAEEHTSELQSLMRNSYAVFFLKKKKN